MIITTLFYANPLFALAIKMRMSHQNVRIILLQKNLENLSKLLCSKTNIFILYFLIYFLNFLKTKIFF